MIIVAMSSVYNNIMTMNKAITGNIVMVTSIISWLSADNISISRDKVLQNIMLSWNEGHHNGIFFLFW